MLLGDLLLQKKLITQEDLDSALREQRTSNEFLGGILVKRLVLREEDLLKVLSEQFGIPWVNLRTYPIQWEVASRFSSELVLGGKCMPLKEDDKGILMAIVNPLDAVMISQAEKEARGMNVRLALVSSGDMEEAQKAYRLEMSKKIKKLLEG